MSTSFKKGSRVNFRRARNGATGTGKIVSIQDTSRGAFYEVLVDGGKVTSKFRAAELTLA